MIFLNIDGGPFHHPEFWVALFIGLGLIVALVYVSLLYRHVTQRQTKLDAERHELLESVRIRSVELQSLEKSLTRSQMTIASRESDMRSLVDSLPALFFFKDTKNNHLRVNQRVAETLGLPIEEIEGRPAGEFYPDEAERYYQDDLDVIRSKKPKLNILEPHTPRGGETVWVRTDKYPHFGPDGEVNGIVVFALDVSAEVEAKQDLEQTQAHFRKLVEGTTDFVWETDSDFTFTYASPRSDEFFGMSPEELVGCSAFDFIPPEDLEHKRQLFADLKANPREVKNYLCHILLQGNVRRTYDVAMSPVFDAEGELAGYRGVDRDVTDRHFQDEQRRDLERRLQEADRLESLAIMAGGIAHDFNNILVSVLGYADLAKHDLHPESAAYPRLEKVEKAARKAAALTKQLLAYSGQGGFLVQPHDLSASIHRAAAELRDSVKSRASLELNLAEQLAEVEIDENQFNLAIRNLIENSVEAMPAGHVGKILVSTMMATLAERDLSGQSWEHEMLPGDFVCVEVRDDGEGMEPEVLAKVFDPFFSTKFTGRGLGLAAVLGAVKAQGGTVQINSYPGKGTSVRLYLPAARDVSGRHRITAKIDKDQLRENEEWCGTVLIVDDEQGVRSISSEILRHAGYRVFEAESGHAAKEVVRANPELIDLVLLDRTMPGLDGLETLRALRLLRSDIKVMLCSGYTEAQAREEFQPGDAVEGFIQKPFTPKSLRRSVESVLKTRVN